MSKRWKCASLLMGLALWAGCKNSVSFAEESYQYDDDAGVSMDMEPAPASRGYAGAPQRKSKSSSPMAPPPPPSAAVSSTAPASEPVTETEVQAPVRMVHYDGYVRIRATKTRDLLDEVEALALEMGGRVDRLNGNDITIRVPVAKFDAAWDAVLEMGDVQSHSVRADDISDQFLAVDLRVKTLRTSLERLIELLAKATEEEEKLALLQQITRVTEQLDQFESQLRTLSDLAAMSRITVSAVPRERFTGTSRPEHDGFHWVSQISPFRHGVFDDDHRVGLPETDGLVTLNKKGPFVAESADGTVLWTLRLDNDPVGDGDFWVDTLADRLDTQFAGYHENKVGSWRCLGLDESGADEPYRWQICVQPVGKYLWVSQAFFPNPDQLARYGPLIDQSLKAGGDS